MKEDAFLRVGRAWFGSILLLTIFLNITIFYRSWHDGDWSVLVMVPGFLMVIGAACKVMAWYARNRK